MHPKKTIDHIDIKTTDLDDVVTEAHERFAQGFCVNPESKAILFYNQALEVFLIAYAIDLDLEEVKIGVFNRFKELDEIHYGEEG